VELDPNGAVKLNSDGSPKSAEPFLSGFLADPPLTCEEDADCPGRAACQNDPYTYKHPFYCEGWGRPADVEWLDDGSLLVSDEMNGVVYRVTYKGPSTTPSGNTSPGQDGFPLQSLAISAALVVVMLAAAYLFNRNRNSSKQNEAARSILTEPVDTDPVQDAEFGEYQPPITQTNFNQHATIVETNHHHRSSYSNSR